MENAIPVETIIKTITVTKVIHKEIPDTFPRSSTSVLSDKNERSEGKPSPKDEPRRIMGTSMLNPFWKTIIDKIANNRYRRVIMKRRLRSIFCK
jgi:hypothetical protein